MRTPAGQQQAASPCCRWPRARSRVDDGNAGSGRGGARPRARPWIPGATPRRPLSAAAAAAAAAAARQRRRRLLLPRKGLPPLPCPLPRPRRPLCPHHCCQRASAREKRWTRALCAGAAPAAPAPASRRRPCLRAASAGLLLLRGTELLLLLHRMRFLLLLLPPPPKRNGPRAPGRGAPGRAASPRAPRPDSEAREGRKKKEGKVRLRPRSRPPLPPNCKEGELALARRA